MSHFRVLEFIQSSDRSVWTALWNRWPDKEVAAHPHYAALFAAAGDRVVCASFETTEGGVLFPLIVRPLAREPWTGGEISGWDAISPYGYGGPFWWGCTQAEVAAFWAGLRQWAADQGVVSLFARLSLFPEQLAPFDGEVSDNAPNIVRSLEIEADELWRQYAHKVRKNVNRARSLGLRIEIDTDSRRLTEFHEIYYGTMQRRSAKPGYYFPKEFFEQICQKLNTHYIFFHALSGETVVSTELVLISARHLYSFLGGTREEYFDYRPNDLLKHEIIQWGRANGKSAFVLGGGYGGPDGIFRYKLSFAPNGEVMFRTGQIIFDPKSYSNLMTMRLEWERRLGHEWVPKDGFFPAYRA